VTINLPTIKDNTGKKFHIVNGTKVECQGQDCIFCKRDTDLSFQLWESSIPYPLPPKGKRYKNPLKQTNRGKTIAEICYTCKEIPCYICKRTKCPKWMKEEERKGQEEGCSSWQMGRCLEFSCSKGLIKSHWEKREHERNRKDKGNLRKSKNKNRK
jgi:hypothetical protein